MLGPVSGDSHDKTLSRIVAYPASALPQMHHPDESDRCRSWPGWLRALEVRMLQCGDTKTNIIASDPLKSNAVGWLSGELGHSEVRRDKDGHLAAERFTGTKNPPA
jgi:hypothetical protein